MSDYEIKNLREVEDIAVKHGFSETQEARFPRQELGAMDAIRIAPHVTRAFEAGPDGLELLVFGPHHARDSEMVQEFWAD